jgi:hypothetical protein
MTCLLLGFRYVLPPAWIRTPYRTAGISVLSPTAPRAILLFRSALNNRSSWCVVVKYIGYDIRTCLHEA